MTNVHESILGCIGNTPLVRVNRLNPNPRVTIYAKIESRNPGGSIKDRAALFMIEAAERDGTLTKEKTIIEATSGNTGIGLALVAAVKGYRIAFAMSETASIERQKTLKAFGAELILTPGALGTDGAIEEVYRMVREHPERYYLPDQFNNPANPEAHYEGTGPEIWEQTEGRVNEVVATLGTTGTAMGLLRFFREKAPSVRVVAVEPYMGHKIQGLKNMKESYVPGIFDQKSLDAIVHVRDEDAFETARRLAREEGIFCGMSSGAAMSAALRLAAERDGGVIVAILPDGGDRYLSTTLFAVTLDPGLSIHDAAARAKTPFRPAQEGKARIAVTAPTLAEDLTATDARRFVTADLLSRHLSGKGLAASVVMPVPDLDSRTIAAAIAEGKDLPGYTGERLSAALADLAALGVGPPARTPRTSELVETVTTLVKSLLAKGVAYEKLRSVYFDVSKSRTYGALSGVDTKKIRSGATVDLSAYEKQNPRDFTLLKRATLAELKRGLCVKTEWGNVLPTWHMVAAAAGVREAGTPVDVQVGSIEFLFPHLENLRAVGEAATGRPFANAWVICEQVTDGPAPEPLTVRGLCELGFLPGEIRHWYLSAHYRKPLRAAPETLETARDAHRRLVRFASLLVSAPCAGGPPPPLSGAESAPSPLAEALAALERDAWDALADDLDTPRALAALFRFVRAANPALASGRFTESQRGQALDVLRRLDRVLGLLALPPAASGEAAPAPAPGVPLTPEEEGLLQARDSAREARDFGEADRLRDELARRGVMVFDTPHGARWERREE